MDFSQKNLFGQNVMDLFLKNTEAATNDLMNLLIRGASKNIEFTTKMQLVKTLLQNVSLPHLKLLFENINRLSSIDNQKRNVIHYLVMPCFKTNFTMKTDDFASKIEILLSNGCDIDCKDKYGK